MKVATRRVGFAAAAYAAIGVGTAALAGSSTSGAGVKGWRFAAWGLSLAVFVVHLILERASGPTLAREALRIAVAVALGAFLLALLGPVRSHWAQPDAAKAIVSLLAWPLILGVPAFVAALVGLWTLERSRGTQTAEP